MIIFGIDPGTSVSGYGVIRVTGNSVAFVDFGVVCARDNLDMPDRLLCMYNGLSQKIREHCPQRVSVEEAFYAKNVHTTLVLGQARGVALLAAKQSGAEVAEYSPREIKKTVVGNGNAAKNQVEYMVKMLLGVPAGDHAADAFNALAAALCDFRAAAARARLRAMRQ